MKLTDEEKAMRDGRDGRAVARAMDLLIRYGNALGAESFDCHHAIPARLCDGQGRRRCCLQRVQP